MRERDYDGLLASVATLINMYSANNKAIKLDFSNLIGKFGDADELYVAMGVMVAQITGKELYINKNLFLRKRLGKKYGHKIKKLKGEGIDVAKLMKIIRVAYKETYDIEHIKAKDLIDYYLKTKGM